MVNYSHHGSVFLDPIIIYLTYLESAKVESYYAYFLEGSDIQSKLISK